MYSRSMVDVRRFEAFVEADQDETQSFGWQVRLLRKKIDSAPSRPVRGWITVFSPSTFVVSCTDKMASAAIKQTLRLGMIPADGIGKEVLPVSAGAAVLLKRFVGGVWRRCSDVLRSD